MLSKAIMRLKLRPSATPPAGSRANEAGASFTVALATESADRTVRSSNASRAGRKRGVRFGTARWKRIGVWFARDDRNERSSFTWALLRKQCAKRSYIVSNHVSEGLVEDNRIQCLDSRRAVAAVIRLLGRGT